MIRLLAAAAWLAAPAAAEKASDFFTAKTPAGWERSEKADGADLQIAFTKGRQRITAARFGRGGSKFATFGDFVRSLQAEPEQAVPGSTITLSGLPALVFRREFPAPPAAGKARADAPESRAYEEFVIRNGVDSFWVLSFHAESAVPSGPMQAARQWRRFLATFRLK